MKRKPTSKKTSGKASSLPDSQQAIARLTESATRGELVVVIGSGVSMALTNGTMPALSWKGLVKDGFTYGVKKGRITKEQEKAWGSQLGSSDIDDLLCAAEFVTRKLDAPNGVLYARWIENALKNAKPANTKMESALDQLARAKIPICTLNYDRLLKDCGQMTIEGVRADMDIGQRKFDIERLFVPLKVLPCPPEIPDNDPQREEKLRKWQEENEKPQSFGKVFGQHKRLALLEHFTL